jgi:hypothetical protein
MADLLNNPDYLARPLCKHKGCDQFAQQFGAKNKKGKPIYLKTCTKHLNERIQYVESKIHSRHQ